MAKFFAFFALLALRPGVYLDLARAIISNKYKQDARLHPFFDIYTTAALPSRPPPQLITDLKIHTHTLTASYIYIYQN